MFYYRNSRGGNRRPRGIYGFPWWLFFIFLFNFHSLTWFIITIGIIVMVSLLIRASSSSNAGAKSSWMQQTPYYQPKQQYYQPPAQTQQQPYQSYEQGYQPARETYNEGDQQYQYPAAAEYDQYEQPQAQYPEEMPPQR
ncbi:MAG: hypothetical protein M3Y39_20140 [Chloroflexota bacterium]|nr:hypothetical protein [Chloroflexota bacterium]